MKRSALGLLAAAVTLLTVAKFQVEHILPTPTLLLPPLEEAPGEPEDADRKREEWIEMRHRAAPGTDWRAQDSAFRVRAMAERQETIRRLRAVEAPEYAYLAVNTPALSGQWIERGSGNIAGKTIATEYDAAANRLNVLSAGGNLWRAERAALNWAIPGASTTFAVPGWGYLGRLAGPERLLMMTYMPSGVWRSDDAGVTWQSATGFSTTTAFFGFATRNPTGDVFVLRIEGYPRLRLYASTDRGATFTPVAFVDGAPHQSTLFSPRYDSATVYLLDGLQLKTITPGTHTLVNVSTVPAAGPLGASDFVALSGGVTAGVTFLYAFISRSNNGLTEVYRSLDGGTSWNRRTDVPTPLFSYNSAESSTRDPLKVYAGGVNAYRSHDGAQTWQLVNEWTAYYSNPATKLHADIINFDVFVDSSNNERIYVSTDGGTYESLDDLLSTQNLSLTGMRNGQYYGSYTVRSPPNAIVLGSQDQGYQKATMPPSGIINFTQQNSGDYAHLSTSNNGGTIWMVYPGYVGLDSNPSAPSGMYLWNYAQNNFQGWMFFNPIEADPLNPHRALLAGGGIGANRNRLITLTFNGNNISHSEGSFDFGSRINAIQFSRDGLTRYVVNNTNQFWRDSGAGFTLLGSGMPPIGNFAGNFILVHPTTPGTIYVAGSGYSSPGVLRSTNNGDSFSPFNIGLPNSMINHLAMSADGAHLFAATDVGPYYYDTAAARWIPISAAQSPNQEYWHVDYIDEISTARFSTFGRGIWDFAIDNVQIFRNGFEN